MALGPLWPLARQITKTSREMDDRLSYRHSSSASTVQVLGRTLQVTHSHKMRDLLQGQKRLHMHNSLLGCSISTLVVASSRVVGSSGLARRLASPSTARRISSSTLGLAAWRLRASTLSASTSPTSPHLCRSCAFNAPRKMRSNSSLGLKAHSRSASTRLEG
eukprot:CAMPEP_0203959118 /NCGR_PEP_ID=MMETSP0359-20131031/90297_1 /ASSEMBLY_ACC=CAM_ASM_000338 /TAXON_ID=268821 /ORGANISM="Scrippsiella Hangoei, Strain SHTV-5" /LENGTH=161 /DNA_ID=CAMNT_0050893153 /DNA_START=99 /DNA_END=580 /DNA_ORIENTATION=+